MKLTQMEETLDWLWRDGHDCVPLFSRAIRNTFLLILYIQPCVFICSASLCLLVCAFSPFTFKVIIDMCDSLTIFLIAWGLFCVDLFLLLCLLLREDPLAFVVKLVR